MCDEFIQKRFYVNAVLILAELSLHLILVKEILALVFCSLAVFYGMLRAMMIAGKARKARSVVFPFWH